MMLLSKKSICVSTGSACNSSKLTESHVLKAIKTGEMYINGSIRITIDNLTKKEIEYIIETIKEAVEKLQKISPFKFKDQLNYKEVKNESL